MAIWVIKEGRREGPYQEQDVRELMYEGTYKDTDPAISEGQFDWSTLGQILDRQPAGPSEPSPSLPPAIAEPPPFLPEEPTTADAIPEPEPPPLIPAVSPEPPAPSPPLQVTVVDFQMPLGSMVIFMIKWMLACIPALLILGAIVAMFWAACVAILSAVLH